MRALVSLALLLPRAAAACAAYAAEDAADASLLCAEVVDYDFAPLAGGAAGNNARAVELAGGDGRTKATQVWLRLDVACKSAVKRLACARAESPRSAPGPGDAARPRRCRRLPRVAPRVAESDASFRAPTLFSGADAFSRTRVRESSSAPAQASRRTRAAATPRRRAATRARRSRNRATRPPARRAERWCLWGVALPRPSRGRRQESNAAKFVEVGLFAGPRRFRSTLRGLRGDGRLRGGPRRRRGARPASLFFPPRGRARARRGGARGRRSRLGPNARTAGRRRVGAVRRDRVRGRHRVSRGASRTGLRRAVARPEPKPLPRVLTPFFKKTTPAATCIEDALFEVGTRATTGPRRSGRRSESRRRWKRGW